MINDTTNAECYDSWARMIILTNFVVIGAQIPLSALNIFLTLRTSLIHPNLKAILLTQSAGFCIFSISLIYQLIELLVHDMDSYFHGFIPTFLNIVGVVYSIMIGHVLMIERIIASMMADSYESWRKPMFTVVWFTLLLLYAIYTSVNQIIMNQNKDIRAEIGYGLIVGTYLLLGLSFIEIFACLIVGVKNRRRYKAWLQKKYGNHNLSERYQLSENIRAARQLIPTFLLHFLMSLNVMSFNVLSLYKLIPDPKQFSIFLVTNLLIFSIGCTLIELSLISFHPIFRRSARQLVVAMRSKIGIFINQNSSQIHPTSENNNNINPPLSSPLATNGNEMDRHFEMLKSAWN